MLRLIRPLLCLLLLPLILLGSDVALATIAVPPAEVPPLRPRGAALTVELLSQIGGNISAVAVVEHYVYIGVGPRLVILDVSNPASPTVVGQSPPLGAPINNVEVVDGYAYVTGTAHDLAVLDVHEPTAPSVVGTYDVPNPASRSQGVTVVGTTAYLANGADGLQILDVSRPTAPALHGVYDTPGYAQAAAIVDDLAFVADGSGFLVLDVSTPSKPRLRGSCGSECLSMDVAVQGGEAYLASGWQGVTVVDVADPTAPRVLRTLDPPGYGFAQGITIANNTVYIADGEGGGLHFFQNDPAPGTGGLWSYDTPGIAGEVAVAGNLAFVADRSSLQILDVSQHPPQLTGAYLSPAYPTDIELVGNLAFLSAEHSGLQILDVQDPSAPMLLGTHDTPHRAQAVSVEGTMAYVADLGGGLQIFDVSNPAAPILRGSYGRGGYAIEVQNGLAYVVDGGSLEIVDVRDPANPALLGSYSGAGLDLAVAGPFAYVENGETFKIVDVSNPADPQERGYYELELSSSIETFTVEGERAYVATQEGDVYILGLSGAHNPALLGIYRAGIRVVAIQAVGSRAYLVTDEDVQILDVADPTAPALLAAYDVPGWSANIVVVGDLHYLISEDSGLTILRVTGLPASTGRKVLLPIIVRDGE
ncbi:MAG TPA: hypothetical protein VER55_10010 [Ardenticatenaceae bacterium]|nr:hypothetical protein [Ardenticatenaceae bacterium]